MKIQRRRLELYLIFISFISAAALYHCLGASSTSVGCWKHEALALLKFKRTLTDERDILSSWVGNNCCLWERVVCDKATRNVVSLHLRGNFDHNLYHGFYRPSDSWRDEDAYLAGDKVDSSLAELTHLRHLDLSGNVFQGARIPEFIGSLKHLRYLNLSKSYFHGIIPHSIGNLSCLKVLDLSSQSLILTNMAWVSGLSSLEHLDLHEIVLNETQNLDMIFYNIPSLVEVSLKRCNLSNSNLGRFLNISVTRSKIKRLDLSENYFNGPPHRLFQNMTSLEFLDLSVNDFSQPRNSLNFLSMLPSLSELHMGSCKLHNRHLSPAHLNFSTLSSIRYLDLRWNSFGPKFPSGLRNFSSLNSLDLSWNNLNSSIPVMPNLLELDLSWNYFDYFDTTGIWIQCHLKIFKLIGRRGHIYDNITMNSPTEVQECSQYALESLYLELDDGGPIPESLGRLTNLRDLHIWGYAISPIPEVLGQLKSLEVLKINLSKSRRFGAMSFVLPTFLGELANLRALYLKDSGLTGLIPEAIGRLRSLEVLDLSYNQLSGPIPVSIGQLTKLQSIDLNSNSLEGVVFETHFANLSALKVLDLGNNMNLTFKASHDWLPPFQLTDILLHSCKIYEFPQWLQTQRKVEFLLLSNASMSGPLPTWLQKMHIIYVLDLSHNKISGPLTNLPVGDPVSHRFGQRAKLLLQDNLFKGSIPKFLCRRTDLAILNLSKNRLIGEIPNCLGKLRDLNMLLLNSNGLRGVIPSSLGQISWLSWLKLDDNNLNGELPSDLANLKAPNLLDLSNNKFSGNIPKWIGDTVTTLMILQLHRNNFTGNIPGSLCNNPYLIILDVAHNSLTGPIPRCFGAFKGMVEHSLKSVRNGSSDDDNDVVQVIKGVGLEYTRLLELVINMDLSSNKLDGEIPEELTTLSSLVGLNLSHNHLSGLIPRNIGNMKSLNSLDLSGNELMGMIPPSMANLNFLSYLNLSHNFLSGKIPTGNQLQTLNDPSIYANNKNLCGAPLSKKCSNHEDLTTITINEAESEGVDEPWDAWFYLNIASGFVTGFCGIIGVLAFKRQWRHNLFRFSEATIDKIYIAVVVRVSKIRRREAT